MENKVLPSQSSQPALLPGRFAQRPPGILVPAQPPAVQLLELKRRVPGCSSRSITYTCVCPDFAFRVDPCQMSGRIYERGLFTYTSRLLIRYLENNTSG